MATGGTKTEDEWRDATTRILATYANHIDRLQAVPEVEPGSAVHGDDQVSTPDRTSMYVWASLGSAYEHMWAAQQLWQATGQKTVPTAFSTILRTAVVGACNAYWMVSPPDRDERVARTRLIALASHGYRLDHSKSPDADYLAEMAREVPDAPAMAAADTAAHEARVKALRDQLNGTEAGKGRTFRQTTAIREVAASLYPDDSTFRLSIMLFWQVMSGDAHALMWPKLQRHSAKGVPDLGEPTAAGLYQLRDERSFTDIAMIVLACDRILSAAEQRYDLRRTVPACKKM